MTDRICGGSGQVFVRLIEQFHQRLGLGQQCGLVRVDIQVDPANERSLRVPRKLGFTEEATLRRRLPPNDDGGERRDSVLFTMLAAEYATSRCLEFDYVAYDPLGREL